jgi:hypothetical protein
MTPLSGESNLGGVAEQLALQLSSWIWRQEWRSPSCRECSSHPHAWAARHVTARVSKGRVTGTAGVAVYSGNQRGNPSGVAAAICALGAASLHDVCIAMLVILASCGRYCEA